MCKIFKHTKKRVLTKKSCSYDRAINQAGNFCDCTLYTYENIHSSQQQMRAAAAADALCDDADGASAK